MPWTGKYHVAYCDECGNKWPRSQLVRKLTETGVTEGQNLFAYHRYSSNLWEVVTASEVGTVSMGPFMKEFVQQTLLPDPGGDGYICQEDKGSYTVSGNGIIRSVVGTDISAMQNILFGVSVGRNHLNYKPGACINAKIGYYDSTSMTYFERASFDINGSFRCLFIDAQNDVPVGVDKSNANFYVDVSILTDPEYTNSDYWWVDDFHLADSLDIHETYIPETNGSPITRGVGMQYGMPVICPDCYPFISKTYRPTLEVKQSWSVPGWIEIHPESTDL